MARRNAPADVAPVDYLRERAQVLRRHMLGISPYVQNPAVHLGMQRLHPPIQHLRKPRQIADIPHRQSSLAQRLRRPPGRNQFHTK